MSFYVGKHRLPNGQMKRQLHITNGKDSLSWMQGGVRSNTVFHTDIEYIRIRPYIITKSTSQYVYYGTWPYLSTYQRRWHKYAGYALPAEAKSLIDSGRVFLVASGDYTIGQDLKFNCNSDMKLTTRIQVKDDPYMYTSDDITYKGEVDALYFVSGNYLYIRGDGHYKLTLMVLDINYSSGKIPLNTNKTNEIHISDSQINVNGLDIASLSYIALTAVNTFDSNTVSAPSSKVGKIQLVNTRKSGSGVRFQSDNNGTKMFVGNNMIIDSNHSSKGLQFYRQGKKSLPGSTNPNYKGIPITPILESGEICFVRITVPGYGVINKVFGDVTTSGQTNDTMIYFRQYGEYQGSHWASGYVAIGALIEYRTCNFYALGYGYVPNNFPFYGMEAVWCTIK